MSYCSGPCTNLSVDAVVNQVMQLSTCSQLSQSQLTATGVAGGMEVALEREGCVGSE